jgi:hypothetical protein
MKALKFAALALALMAAMGSAQAYSVTVAHVSVVHVAPHVYVAPRVVYVAPRPMYIAPRPVIVVAPVRPIIIAPMVVHHADVCDSLTYNQKQAINFKAGRMICYI